MNQSPPSSPRRIVIPYMVLAAAWIFVSDFLLGVVLGMPARMTQAEIYKGLLFVGVTGLFLHHLLRREYGRRNQAETAVRESEEKYRTLFDTVPIGLGVSDPGGKLLAYNSAILQPGGYEREDIARIRSVAGLYFDPTERARVLELARQQGRLDRYPIRFKKKDGSPYEALLSLERITVSDRPCWLALVEDVTALRYADRQIQLQSKVLEVVANSVVITDLDGAIEWVNPAFVTLTGWQREEVIGKNPRLLRSGRNDPDIYRDLWETILAGSVWSGKLVNQRKDGSLYTQEMTITPAKDDQGNIAHFIAVQQDVTEREQAKETLYNINKMEALGRLAGGIVHDSNNVLMAISGFSQMALQEIAADSPARKDLMEIQGAVGRLSKIMHQLLAFTRNEVPTPKVINYNSLISGFDPLLRRLVRPGIDLVLELHPAAGSVVVDPSQMERVITNLVMNASDALPHEGMIIIRTGNADLRRPVVSRYGEIPPGEYVLLEVVDNGTGMDDEVASHLFEPFFTTKDKGKGTGLGLSTVYGSVKQAGGHVYVDSELGGGTTFAIYLPRVPI
ncbi:MAG: PAS domain S-box protein [Acidobacteria bacterium]|nr:PAS domain S-box protein [Acidobacteriota bacterium]